MSFTIGSLFDGSGGFPLAASMCGGIPKWAAEVEPYPIAVTKSRFPGMKHLGSVTDINGGEIDPVDVISFGSPCQDLSVAGKRAGLKHEVNGDDETTRSGLFMEAIRIIKEMREATNGVYPRFALWENVPGAFSSNKGEDFRIVLQELIQIAEPSAVMPEVPKNGWSYADSYCGDGWSLAYRVFDAQYWGVPQRRRRVYALLDLRGECARKVSFECEGLRGYFETGRTPWQAAPGDAEAGSGTADCERTCVGWPLGFRPENTRVYDECATTLCNGTRPGFTCGVIECVPTTFEPGIAAREGGHIYEGVSGTLRAKAGDNQMAVAYPEAIGFDMYNQQSTGDVCRTLKTPVGGDDIPVCVYSIENHPADSRVNIDDSGKVQTLTSRMGTGGGNVPMVMEPVVYESHPMDSRVKELDGVSPTVSVKWHKGAADTPLVCEPISCIDGDKIGKAERAGGSGLGIRPGDKMYTLTAKDAGTHAVAYSFDALNSNSMKSSNPHSGCRQVDTARTIDTTDQNPSKNQGGIAVLEAVPYTLKIRSGCETDVHGKAAGKGALVQTNMSATLATTNDQYLFQPVSPTDGDTFETYQKVTGPLMANSHPGSYTGQDAFSDMLVAGVDCRNATEYTEMTGALQADSAHNLNSNNVVRVNYIVRRLTPTECARLQGFPDKWGHPDEKTEFTDEEYQFWLNVRNTHAEINGKATKEYTKDQILKWYNGLHTDSSEYKMWGNGIALPNALYIMQGIADVMESEEKVARKKWLDDLLGGCL